MSLFSNDLRRRSRARAPAWAALDVAEELDQLVERHLPRLTSTDHLSRRPFCPPLPHRDALPPTSTPSLRRVSTKVISAGGLCRSFASKSLPLLFLRAVPAASREIF